MLIEDTMAPVLSLRTKQPNGRIRAINGGCLAPPLRGAARQDISREFKELNLPITRLHDAPLENAGYRLVDVCHSREAVCKVILETCYLTEPAKKLACEVALDTGIDYVKTSTGFGTAGATAQDVRLFRSIVGGHVKIKAAGAMRTLDDVTAVLEAGADRIGSAFSVSILKEFQARHSGL